MNFNDSYLKKFEDAGMKAVGVNPETKLVEAMELIGHPLVCWCPVPS